MNKTRVSVTLTRPYLDAPDRLVTEGIYLSQGEAMHEGLENLQNILLARYCNRRLYDELKRSYLSQEKRTIIRIKMAWEEKLTN